MLRLFLVVALALAGGAHAATNDSIPSDSWPRDISIAGTAVLIYQPQVSKWEGNHIDFRAALAIKPAGAKEETFGVIFANARTQVDKVARTVVFEDLKITKTDFPTLPDRGARYAAALQKKVAADVRTIRSIDSSLRSPSPASSRRWSMCATIRRRCT